MSSDQDIDALSKINHRFVASGANLPAVTLPDGSKLQTGTVGALLLNIKAYDRVCNGEVDSSGLSKEELEHALTLPIPTLHRIGFFDLFPSEEWLAGKSLGRKFVGQKAKEMGY